MWDLNEFALLSCCNALCHRSQAAALSSPTRLQTVVRVLVPGSERAARLMEPVVNSTLHARPSY